jgi:uncharacterized membrane protein
MSLTQVFLIIHLLAIAMALGIGFSNIVGFRVAKNLGGDMAKGIAAHRESLIPYGDIFFVTIIASGLILLWGIGGGQGLSPWFHAKMAFVLVWMIVYVVMRLRIRKFLASRDMTLIALIRTYAHIAITAATVALICAVMAFAV